jgi:deoxyuridine 5'-triphosphate nucleotidohydrolase
VKLYVAGPMSGLPDHNFPAFHTAARSLRNAGYEVICPAEGVVEEVRLEGIRLGREFNETEIWQRCMRRDFQSILQVDGIALLGGWMQSKGARAEDDLASHIGIPRKPVAEWIEEAHFHHNEAVLFVGDERWMPVQSFEGDAGFDLWCSERTEIMYQSFKDVPCGISIQLPLGVWAMITGRSSTVRRRGMLVTQGIIDNGYRGPLYAGVQNLSDGRRVVEEGERIAQLIPFELTARRLRFEYTDELGPSDRGEAGFGSSGD